MSSNEANCLCSLLLDRRRGPLSGAAFADERPCPQAKVLAGHPDSGLAAVGDGKDTDRSPRPLRQRVLDAAGTTHPDGACLKAPIASPGAENWLQVRSQAPKMTKPEPSHFIPALTDEGDPSLRRYRRAIATIEPGN
jgi:hypothetical protein